MHHPRTLDEPKICIPLSGAADFLPQSTHSLVPHEQALAAISIKINTPYTIFYSNIFGEMIRVTTLSAQNEY